METRRGAEGVYSSGREEEKADQPTEKKFNSSLGSNHIREHRIYEVEECVSKCMT